MQTEKKMTGRERILATLRGEKTDRVPLWLMDSFARIPPGNPPANPPANPLPETPSQGVHSEKYLGCLTPHRPFKHRFSDTIDLADPIDPWTERWMIDDENFNAVRKAYWERCELFYEYKKLSPYGYCNRMLAIPDRYITKIEETYTGKRKINRYRIETPKGNLYSSVAWDYNVATPWQIEYPIKNAEDARKILSLHTRDQRKPQEMNLADFWELERHIGDRGIMMILINTPMVTVSSAFPFEEYLMMTITEPELIKEMIAAAYEQIEQALRHCLEAGMGPVYRIMGSEQAIPPMGSPETYAASVHAYEKKMITLIHSYGRFAAVHCHGNIREVLPWMAEAGTDLLDPVEAPPSGDISFTEAAITAGGNMTLAGNIQYEDLASRTPEQINTMVKELFADGKKDHKIVSCTGYPITGITEQMRDNYLALIYAVHEHGRIDG